MKKLLKTLALLVLGVSLGAQTPDPPPLKLFNEWLAAFNSGNAETLRAFLERSYPDRLRNLEGDLTFRERTGGFEIARVESSTAERLVCVLKERASDQFARATVDVAPGKPLRMASFSIRAIPTPPDLASPPSPRTIQPDTPAEGQLRAWLEVFNRGSSDELRAFLLDRFPSRLPVLERDIAFRASTGGFTFVRLESATSERVTAILQERISDQFARATMDVDSAAPHAITALTVRVIPRPADIPLARLSEPELATQLRARLAQSAAQDQFSGAVLVVRRGTPVVDGAYGLADRESRLPNDTATKFRVGSMDKMFTATAVLQLVQAGRIALDAPLSTYLPDYPNRAVAQRVTIHQLLTHTGGTGDIFGPEFDAHRLTLRTLGDYVALYGARELAFEPGTRWEYSNYGYILLGRVIEAVSGQSYYDYVREHVFLPAGMTSTGFDPEDVDVPGRARGYMRSGAAWVSNRETLPYRGTSAGGGYSTVGDLVRFADALWAHRLLSARYTALLTTGKTKALGSDYAYGFRDVTENGVHSIGHSGGAPGMSGDLRIFPDDGYVIVVLSNVDSAASRVASWIAERLPLPAR